MIEPANANPASAEPLTDATTLEPLVDSAVSLQSKWRRALPLAAMALIAVVLIASGLYRDLNLATLAEHHATLKAFTAQHPWPMFGALVGAIALMVASGLPGGALLVIAGGVLFGTVLGALSAVIGDVIGGSLLYGAARHWFMRDGRAEPGLVARLREGFSRSPASFALFVRIVPVFPFGAVSVALAWVGCRFRTFVWTSALGAVPGSLAYAALGAGIAHVLYRHETVSLSIVAEPRFFVPIVALALLALVPAALKFIRAWRTRRRD